MKRLMIKLQNRYMVFLHDLVMIPLAWISAYLLRFNLDDIPAHYWHQALLMLPLVLLVQGGMFWYFGLYRGVWRFASVPDLMRIFKAVVAGVVVSAVAIFFLTRLQGVPRSVFLFDALLLIMLLGGPRFAYRWLKDHRLYGQEGKNILIVGAGQAGEMLVRDLLRDPLHSYRPTVFVDDAPAKHGKDIHGVRVVSACDAIPELVRDLDVQLILIALPSASSPQMQRIVGLCETTRVPFRILPRMQDLMSGQVGLREFREVKIDDLLGREAVSLDWKSITSEVRGKSILVSGGGGSIGSELCRQILRLEPARLIILEQGEFNLYAIELELRREFPGIDLVAILGSVADHVAVENCLSTYRPEMIFHAAAYKHVPMLENQARAAVMNNVLGTRVLAAMADKYQCKSFVMISTDKAVNPGNIMGTTKRMAEIFCQNLNARSGTRFITVRFGNVLGSAGSVIPLFQKQITAGGPVTVTHPDITRYFMTIPEAAQLILQASVLGAGGEIFVLDMGEPVKISYLAEQLILLSGKRPGEDISIVYTGLRPGEKLYEELFHPAEKLTETRHPKILLAQSRQVDLDALQAALDELETACQANDDELIRKTLHRLVPEHAEQVAKAAVILPWKNQTVQ